MRILLIDDDPNLTKALKTTLTNQRYIVDVANRGQTGAELARGYNYDLIILDVVLPDIEGIKLCQQLRQEGIRIPILLLTALDANQDIVRGLDAGADDYLAKPFNWPELLARVRALQRRPQEAQLSVLTWGKICLDRNTCQVSFDGKPVPLRPKEYSLLELFLSNSRQIFSCNSLLEQLWSFEELPEETTVRTHIKVLRKKLKAAGAKDVIETVHGLGYRLKPHQHSQPKTPPPSPSTTSLQQPELNENQLASLEQALVNTWEEVKDGALQEVSILEQATVALVAGKLYTALRSQAIASAHKLAGLMGTFGFAEGSRLARHIEALFERSSLLNSQQVECLQSWLVALRRELQEKPSLTEDTTLEPTPLFKDPSVAHQSRLVIVSDDPFLKEQLQRESVQWHINVETITELAAIKRGDVERPNIVLVDFGSTLITQDVLVQISQLTTATTPISVVVMSKMANLHQRLRASQAGVCSFLRKGMSACEVMRIVAGVRQQVRFSQSARILVVDDEPKIRVTLHSLLTPIGLQLTVLENPQQFWDTLERVSPDLLLLKVKMPEISGIELCKIVRNDPYWAKLPILFLIASNDREILPQVFRAGANDFVSKPIIGPELVSRVMSHLKGRVSYRQPQQLSTPVKLSKQSDDQFCNSGREKISSE